MPFFVKGEKIVLKKDGTWVADGVEITHDQTREAFFRNVHWDEDQKQYYIEIGYERMFIEVEDTAYFVLGLTHDRATVGAGYWRILAQVSNFSEVQIAPPGPPDGKVPLHYENGKLYLDLPNGHRAKFLSVPFYDLMKSLEEDETHYFLTIEGKRVNLSPKGSENLAGIQDDRLSGLKRH